MLSQRKFWKSASTQFRGLCWGNANSENLRPRKSGNCILCQKRLASANSTIASCAKNGSVDSQRECRDNGEMSIISLVKYGNSIRPLGVGCNSYETSTKMIVKCSQNHQKKYFESRPNLVNGKKLRESRKSAPPFRIPT